MIHGLEMDERAEHLSVSVYVVVRGVGVAVPAHAGGRQHIELVDPQCNRAVYLMANSAGYLTASLDAMMGALRAEVECGSILAEVRFVVLETHHAELVQRAAAKHVLPMCSSRANQNQPGEHR